ncbi:MAG: dockerin type I domain-containing protein, partial [Eubacterium sp.]
NLNHLDEASAVTGDADGDGYVNVSDLRIVKSNFGQSVQTGQNGDVDFDGFVNVSDLRVVKSNFGKQI